jgi:anti-sigma factor RsiW
MTHDAHCQQLLEQICEYMDGELEPGMCVDLETHLAECADCRAALESLRKTVALYRRCAPDELPPEVRARLDAILDLDSYST